MLSYILVRQWHGALNRQTIIHVIDDVMKQLNARRRNLVLLLTDAARYVTAAGNVLGELYPRLSNVTCIANFTHNCTERVRNYFPAVDNLIAAIKLVTV